jgi:hypothetical protein
MSESKREDSAYYNLEGGPRRIVLKNGAVKAVAPGLRLVDATAEEKKPFEEQAAARQEPLEYGLPV